MPKIKIPDLLKPLETLKKPIVATDFYACCHNGHNNHVTKQVAVKLNGEHKGIHDVPPIPEHLATNLKLNIYDWKQYFETVDGNETHPMYETYCPGQDIISYSIDKQGVWEAYETLLVLDVLKNGDAKDLVLDFGSHVGWYSILAATAGYKVASFDALAENIEMVKSNAKLNGLTYRVFPFLSWIDEEAPLLPNDRESVHFVKIDIEGLESHAIRMLEPLLAAQKVNYLMIEVSPVFGDYYPDLVEKIAGYGYKVYQIPGKGYQMDQQYGKSPLQVVKTYCEIPAAGREKYIRGLQQENFLFIKDNL